MYDMKKEGSMVKEREGEGEGRVTGGWGKAWSGTEV